MLDFTSVRKKELTMGQLVADLTPDDLRRLTDEQVNPVARFVWGLKHDDDHLEQIGEIVRQACSARDA